MAQLSFDSAPALDQHIDFSAIAPEPRIADIEIVRKLHRRDFAKMDANDRNPGKVVVYRIQAPEQDAPEQAPAPQGMVPNNGLREFGPERMRERVAAAKLLQAATLDGRDILSFVAGR